MQGNYTAALKYAKKIVMNVPEYLEYKVLLAKIYIKLDMHKYALECLMQAINYNQRHDVLAIVGKCQKQLGRFSDAINSYKSANSLFPCKKYLLSLSRLYKLM